jgi:phosphorylcholine metabolism protein LicD
MISGKKWMLAFCVYTRITKLFRELILKELHNVCTKGNYESAQMLSCLIDGYKTQKVYPKLWFDQYVKFPYENLLVRIPQGYKEYLTLEYNEYMKYPPVSERCSNHSILYINLRERKSLMEIKSQIKINNGK